MISSNLYLGITCSGNGACVVVSPSEFQCNCNDGFTGQQCEAVIDSCAGQKCFNCSINTFNSCFLHLKKLNDIFNQKITTFILSVIKVC